MWKIQVPITQNDNALGRNTWPVDIKYRVWEQKRPRRIDNSQNISKPTQGSQSLYTTRSSNQGYIDRSMNQSRHHGYGDRFINHRYPADTGSEDYKQDHEYEYDDYDQDNEHEYDVYSDYGFTNSNGYNRYKKIYRSDDWGF